jgi:hypothetical protein
LKNFGEDVTFKKQKLTFKKTRIINPVDFGRATDWIYDNDLKVKKAFKNIKCKNLQIERNNRKAKEEKERERRKIKNRKVKFKEQEKKVSVLKKNIEYLKKVNKEGKMLTSYERFCIHKENILETQRIFYRAMENNPSLFKIPTLLNLRKRRMKNAVGSENDFCYEIKYIHDYKKDEDLFNTSQLVCFYVKAFLAFGQKCEIVDKIKE